MSRVAISCYATGITPMAGEKKKIWQFRFPSSFVSLRVFITRECRGQPPESTTRRRTDQRVERGQPLGQPLSRQQAPAGPGRSVTFLTISASMTCAQPRPAARAPSRPAKKRRHSACEGASFSSPGSGSQGQALARVAGIAAPVAVLPPFSLRFLPPPQLRLGVEPRPQRRGLRRPRRQPDRCRPAAVGPAAGDRCPQRAEAPPPGECSRCRTRLDSCIASLGLVVVAGLGREDRQVRDRVPATAAALPRRGSSTAPASGGRPGWKTADSTRRCRPLWERARPGSRATCWTRAPG